MSSGCTQPVIAENEMNGANLVTPWTANNAQYRRNVLIYMQTLSALGARPVLLVPSAPYMGDEAGDWSRQLSQYADVVRESSSPRPASPSKGRSRAAGRCATCFASASPSSPPTACRRARSG